MIFKAALAGLTFGLLVQYEYAFYTAVLNSETKNLRKVNRDLNKKREAEHQKRMAELKEAGLKRRGEINKFKDDLSSSQRRGLTPSGHR